MTSPKIKVLLGDLNFKDSTTPMGGINPHSPQFDLIGKQFHQLLVDHTGFNPQKSILDIGCGTGRLTKQLHKWMKPGGRYSGFEINNRFFDYCKNNYQGDFYFLDIFHDEYNCNGTIQADNVTLPFKDKSFDVVVAIALFNHLRLNWATHYLEEIARILKHQGTLFATAILINPISLQSVKLRKSHPFIFETREDLQWFDFSDRPLFNVALSENVLRRVMMKNGLMVKEPIRYGEWCGSKAAITGHDVILARKGGWL
jgi:SAM-dependent methyltransferase